uniref:PX domain-containing protein n=1 Tax=Globisporangium ultimum (strain ATCC 200006 / CBS 805.95 / DAOM BR144) TaxID=431595 RepID=K3WTC4_GLOUD
MVQSSVECELCNEPYGDESEHTPRLLSCGHTFCQSCLDDWASHGANAELAHGENVAVVECPTCRRPTSFSSRDGARSLPKNFELLRVRHEIESQTQAQLRHLKEVWANQVWEKEQLAREAQENAKNAERESVQASQRAHFLARQVQINEQEKKHAQDMAEEARQKAILASQRAEELQQETESLKQQLQNEAMQLERVQNDASSAAAVAAALHSKAEKLQQQVDRVRAQLSLHSGRHDPTKLVVLVNEPTTVGSWLLPYTRYAVISIASDALHSIDPYQAAKTWTMMRQFAEPSSSVKVYRRYSDFVWLHRALTRQFPFELVPCVPGKQLFFNKEKEFVGERMRLLQAFVREVLRHPLLAVTEEVRAFLLSTTEELETLRKASSVNDEVDELLGSESDISDTNGANGTGDKAAASSAPAKAVAPVVQSSAWAAWGAVSAITSSAAKLVTSTGSALTSIGTKSANGSSATASSSDVDSDPQLSDSLLSGASDGLQDKAQARRIEKRRKYIEIARSYQSTAQKGSHLSRVERNQSQHLHRLCELMDQMNTLDQSYAKRRHELLATSVDRRNEALQRQQEEEEVPCFERPSFDARASEAFSALSLKTKNDADCMEYALLEIVRMQTLELGAIEDAFSRIRQREQVLQKLSPATASSSSSMTSQNGYGSPLSSGYSSPATSQLWNSKQEELQQHRRELGDMIESLDPARSQFVFDTLQKNSGEMHKLALAKRTLLESTYQQLLAACRTR